MKRNEILIFILLILFYFFWFALPTSLVGSENFRMIDSFNTDEADILKILKTEIKSRGFNLRFYGYGHLYYNSGLVPLIIRDIFSPVSEKEIIVFYRLLSSLYFMGTIMVVFFLARKFFGKITAWLSVVLLLVTSSKMYFYSTMLHPDTAQIFFIALSLFFCCKYFENFLWKNLVFASVFAGFAFSSKYAGMMLMPIIFAIHIFFRPTPEKINRQKTTLVFFFFLAASVLLNEQWFLKYVTLNENSQPFFLILNIAQYGSFFLTAFFLCALMYKKIAAQKQIRFVLEKISDVVILSVIFLCAFAITSPGCIRGLNFVDGFMYGTSGARYGHWFRESLGVSGWLKILLSKDVLNYTIFILFLSGVLFCAAFINKEKFKKYFPHFLILFSWIAIYFVTLVLRINAGFAHYLLPVVPFVILLGSYVIERIIQFLKNKFSFKFSSIITVAVPLFVLGFESFQSAKNVFHFRNDLVNKVENSDAVKAGLFLRENFPNDTRILYDRYSYIPPEFSNCFASWGITQKQIMETMPQLIFLHHNIYPHYLNEGSAEKYLYGGKKEYLEKYNAYTSILSGNSEFELLKGFGSVKVFSTSKKWEKEIIFQSENNYESQNEKWTYSNTVIDSANYFSGKKSEKIIGEYSSTFSALIQDFRNDSLPHPFYACASVYGLLSEGASAILVIDFLRNGSERIGNWEVKNIFDVQPDENGWRKINFCRQIPIEILPTDEIKIYVWNNGNLPVFVDDFNVEIYRLK